MKVTITIREMKQGPLTKVYKIFKNAVRVIMTVDKETGAAVAIVHAGGHGYAFPIDRYDVIVEG